MDVKNQIKQTKQNYANTTTVTTSTTKIKIICVIHCPSFFQFLVSSVFPAESIFEIFLAFRKLNICVLFDFWPNPLTLKEQIGILISTIYEKEI